MITLLCGIVAIAALDEIRTRRLEKGAWRKPAAVLLAAVLGAFLGRPPGAVTGKCIGRLLMPVGLAWSAGLVAIVLVLRRRRRAGSIALALWLAFSLMGNDWVAHQLLQGLESRVAEARPLSGPRLDAVVVLGGGVGATPFGEGQAGMSGDRVVLAARLYHRGRTRRLIAVGANVPGYSIQDDAAVLTANIWRDLQVPESAIVVHRAGAWNTSLEIAAASALCRERGWSNVGLVTSAWHLRRALKHCEAHGWTVVPLPADWRGLPRYDGLLTLIPNGDAFGAIHHVCWEYLGAAVGR